MIIYRHIDVYFNMYAHNISDSETYVNINHCIKYLLLSNKLLQNLVN